VHELGELRLVQVVLERERLDLDLPDGAAIVGLVDELAQKIVLQGAGGQCSLRSFLQLETVASLRRRSKRWMRPPRACRRSAPV
jgi:hypothetical protein